MSLKNINKYTGKYIILTIKDRLGKELDIFSKIRHEFNYGKYDIIRMEISKEYLEEIKNMECFYFVTPPIRYLNISDIKIDGVKFKDRDFGWIDIEGRNLKIFIYNKYTSPIIDILLKTNPDNSVSIIYAVGDHISRMCMYRIMSNL